MPFDCPFDVSTERYRLTRLFVRRRRSEKYIILKSRILDSETNTKKKRKMSKQKQKNYQSKYNDSEMKIRRRRRRRRPLLNANCPRMKLSVGQKMSSTSHICSSRLKRKCQRNETAGHNVTELFRLFLVNTAFLLKSILKIYQPFKLFFLGKLSQQLFHDQLQLPSNLNFQCQQPRACIVYYCVL